jgi:hypothetical protein
MPLCSPSKSTLSGRMMTLSTMPQFSSRSVQTYSSNNDKRSDGNDSEIDNLSKKDKNNKAMNKDKGDRDEEATS